MALWPLWPAPLGGRKYCATTSRQVIQRTCVSQVSKSEFEWQESVVKAAVDKATAALSARLPYIKPLAMARSGASYHISCKTGEGVSELRTALIAFAERLPFYGELLPANWLRVRQGYMRAACNPVFLSLRSCPQADSLHVVVHEPLGPWCVLATSVSCRLRSISCALGILAPRVWECQSLFRLTSFLCNVSTFHACCLQALGFWNNDTFLAPCCQVPHRTSGSCLDSLFMTPSCLPNRDRNMCYT
jgi:hypothetical protein